MYSLILPIMSAPNPNINWVPYFYACFPIPVYIYQSKHPYKWFHYFLYTLFTSVLLTSTHIDFNIEVYHQAHPWDTSNLPSCLGSTHTTFSVGFFSWIDYLEFRLNFSFLVVIMVLIFVRQTLNNDRIVVCGWKIIVIILTKTQSQVGHLFTMVYFGLN